MSPSPVLPSEKRFGLFMSIVFTGLAIYAFFKGFIISSAIAAVVAGLLCLFALIAPNKLAQHNQLWFQFGLLLGKVVSPVVLGIMFFVLITPVALITRLLGRDALALKKRTQTSYWIDRTPPGPSGDSFKNQF